MDEGRTSRNTSDPAHDVLAAEEFALPAADPSIGHAPVALPDDPSGNAEPHDVLAAEEFALPASAPRRIGPLASSRRGSGRVGVAVGAVAVVLLRRVVRAARRGG